MAISKNTLIKLDVPEGHGEVNHWQKKTPLPSLNGVSDKRPRVGCAAENCSRLLRSACPSLDGVSDRRLKVGCAAEDCSQLLPSLDGVSGKRLKVGCAADFAVIPVWWNLRFA